MLESKQSVRVYYGILIGFISAFLGLSVRNVLVRNDFVAWFGLLCNMAVVIYFGYRFKTGRM